ncbi:MAG TPA: hypothetical protein VMY78_16525 [Solirubrobacteraceae bacterium]|nr:hypothetical protein [Solirubrobacteraceae bacterium]
MSDELDALDVGPFDPDELVQWAESYGHPESWAKRAQAAHARAEDLAEQLHREHAATGLAFGDLGKIGAQFQGGFIVLQGYGCTGCGGGFWTEADDSRRLAPGAIHPCPHCGQRREVAPELPRRRARRASASPCRARAPGYPRQENDDQSDFT